MTGKGLYATKDIAFAPPPPRGSRPPLFEELPIAYPPYLSAIKLLTKGEICLLCGRLLKKIATTIACVSCGGSWCNRLCQGRDETHYSTRITCTKRNKPWLELLEYCARNNWRSPLTVGLLWARALVPSVEKGNKTAVPKIDPTRFAEINAFACISEEARASLLPEWMFEENEIRNRWQHTYRLLLQCFMNIKIWPGLPSSAINDPLIYLPELTFDHFLCMLGSVNLNFQTNGLYLVCVSFKSIHTKQNGKLQSHANHSCMPNALVRHPQAHSDYKLALYPITDIPKGDEITITYVNPRMNRLERQATLLRDYGFRCECARCCAADDALDEHHLKWLFMSS